MRIVEPCDPLFMTIFLQFPSRTTYPLFLCVPKAPAARDELDDAAFHAMLEQGMNEAKAGNSRPASDVFADLKREML